MSFSCCDLFSDWQISFVNAKTRSLDCKFGHSDWLTMAADSHNQTMPGLSWTTIKTSFIPAIISWCRLLTSPSQWSLQRLCHLGHFKHWLIDWCHSRQSWWLGIYKGIYAPKIGVDIWCRMCFSFNKCQYVVVNMQQCSKLMVYSTCITTFFVLIS